MVVLLMWLVWLNAKAVCSSWGHVNNLTAKLTTCTATSTRYHAGGVIATASAYAGYHRAPGVIATISAHAGYLITRTDSSSLQKQLNACTKR